MSVLDTQGALELLDAVCSATTHCGGQLGNPASRSPIPLAHDGTYIRPGASTRLVRSRRELPIVWIPRRDQLELSTSGSNISVRPQLEVDIAYQRQRGRPLVTAMKRQLRRREQEG